MLRLVFEYQKKGFKMSNANLFYGYLNPFNEE